MQRQVLDVLLKYEGWAVETIELKSLALPDGERSNFAPCHKRPHTAGDNAQVVGEGPTLLRTRPPKLDTGRSFGLRRLAEEAGWSVPTIVMLSLKQAMLCMNPKWKGEI